MISLGSDSKCDVCLDTFNGGHRTPCAIECGHVFCSECLSLLSSANCPLCRAQIDSLSYIKLIVDWDSAEADSSKAKSLPEPSQDEAQRLMNGIADMTNHGSNETQLSQLIHNIKSFLASQPRDQFIELRTCHRLIKYIYDYKRQARQQQRELNVDLQLEKDRSSGFESRVEEYRIKNQALENELLRSRESHREQLAVIERLTRIMESLSMQPSSTDEGWVHRPRQHPGIARASSPSFIISPLPELILTDLPEVVSGRRHGSPLSSDQSDAEKAHSSNTSDASSSHESTESESEEEPVDDSGRRSNLGRRSIGRMSTTPAPQQRYSNSYSTSPPRSTEAPTEPLPLQQRFNALLSDSPPQTLPTVVRTSPSPAIPRAPSRIETPFVPQLPSTSPAPGATRVHLVEANSNRGAGRYANLPPPTSASAAAQQALERRQNQAREAERNSAPPPHHSDEESAEPRRSSSRGAHDSRTYRMSSSSTTATAPQLTTRSTSSSARPPPQPSPGPGPRSSDVPRSTQHYSSRSGSMRQSSATSRPPSHYYPAASTIGRSSSSMGRNSHEPR